MSSQAKRRGLMLVLSSPSGAGKTTLSRLLLARDPETVLSISYTTRPPRKGERDGADYFFVSDKKFREMVKAGAFLEYAQVFGNWYGTPRAWVEQENAKGKDVLFDIDWQGTQQLIQLKDREVVKIFILPPSIRSLSERLGKRGRDTPEQIKKRMETAHEEISHWAEYDYVLINENLDACLEEIQEILSVERKKRERQSGLVDFVKNLMNEAIR